MRLLAPFERRFACTAQVVHIGHAVGEIGHPKDVIALLCHLKSLVQSRIRRRKITPPDIHQQPQIMQRHPFTSQISTALACADLALPDGFGFVKAAYITERQQPTCINFRPDWVFGISSSQNVPCLGEKHQRSFNVAAQPAHQSTAAQCLAGRNAVIARFGGVLCGEIGTISLTPVVLQAPSIADAHENVGMMNEFSGGKHINQLQKTRRMASVEQRFG